MCPCSDPGWFEWGVRVRYADTDAQGTVYHARYLEFLEAARSELIRHLGLSQRGFEENGVGTVVTHLELRFRNPARVDDVLRVLAQLGRIRSREVEFKYRVEHAESGRLLLEGATRHVFVDEAGRVVQVPAFVLDLLSPPV